MTPVPYTEQEIRRWAAEQAVRVMISFDSSPWVPTGDEDFAKIADLFYNYVSKAGQNG